ncbi:MAG TPA: VWA domain-containing protein [Bryobacteraceae bacterium]|nr:VWA domain-containing protein [Bryobacteraceae bacterium]
MRNRGLWAAILFAGAMASADNIALRGKVLMEDGSVPTRTVAIERDCGNSPQHVASTNAKGEYVWHADVNTASDTTITTTNTIATSAQLANNLINNSACVLRATLPGYESNVIQIDDLNSFTNPVLPTFVLVRRGSQANFNMLAGSGVPHSASRAWNRAVRAIHAKNFPEAERQLRAAVQSAPRFAQGWNALATVFLFEQKNADAREAYQHAVAANPKMPEPYLLLARLDMSAQDWPAMLHTSEGLLKADAKHEYPEAYLYQAIARYQLGDGQGAEASAAEAIRIDKRHVAPAAEYVYGLILEARREYAPAGEHMQKYLALAPKAPDAGAVRSRIESLGKPEAAPVAAELQSVAANLQLARAGDAWVPGGMKALAAAARMQDVPSPQDFFAEYCRAIIREVSPATTQGIPQYLETLRTYISTVSALSLEGRRDNDRITVALSFTGDLARAERVLGLLGWKLSSKGDSIEPGDQPSDSIAQRMPALLGIDELKMEQTLGAGRVFQFEIISENAPLIGGGAWTALLKDKSLGIATAFATDVRLARAYAGLGSMEIGAASALTAAFGLRTLVTQYADLLARDSGAFVVSGGAVETPGDPAVWGKLTGANPSDPPRFFRALIEKDERSLVRFYSVLWGSDSAHRRFFLQNADKFYAWDRREVRSWRTDFFEKLPLDEHGQVKFPGGRGAWTDSSDIDSLLRLPSLEALVPIAQIEQKRGAGLDEPSAKLLMRHFHDWQALFPYFEKLPALGRDEFAALESFANSVEKFGEPARNIALGEWDSLVDLMARGAAAGTLNPEQSARAFRDACVNLAVPEPSARALDLLRAMAGGADVDDALPARLLRLTGARRAGFDRVLELQKVPRIAAAKTPREMLEALTGNVYAASLDPDGLLVNEDPSLLSRHRFAVDDDPTPFPAAALNRPVDGQGSYLSGTFASFDRITSKLAPGGKNPVQATPVSALTSAGSIPVENAPPSAAEVTFRASGRLVEVFTTVTDSSGHYVDDLARDQFTISDNGTEPKVVAFEPRSSEVSVALLLDTTGSMYPALPALKNAALKLIGELRSSDSIAVYSFNNSVHELQPFTTDKDAAKRAVLTTEALGETALYDALTRVGRDLASRGGKKVIVVFTDGDDNSSTLTADTAIERAKAAGIPVYTIAQGEALEHPVFLKQLAGISKATGGVAFAIHEPREIRGVFEKVSADLTHGYLLVFQPAPAADRAWRTIEVGLKRARSYKIRARDGYYPE